MALLLYLSCMVGIHGAIWFLARDSVAKGYQDFTIFYSAGQIVRQGMGHHLYDEAVEWRIQQQVAPHVKRLGPQIASSKNGYIEGIVEDRNP